ncbi:transcription initiation factor TFIID subunit 1 isoform X2 [Lotus japonicus]|uniref:transcription initiation factor TFIID subunit 1 isoform X2 n=1 Tax=Lotus japonicus TaxID=34305 RepID=UPI0025855808|nr:transcription initiation factor TFIID subunit 1 isoform X2 [Lotus japonicus]
MGYDSDSPWRNGREEDDEEEYEESDKGNRFLGFMFGNVDNSGDLDVDYLDEDAKEHLSALADKLGPSLTDIDLSGKSPQTPHDVVEQDCGEKAEDAVDYEDIDEEYDGPETETANEEDYLLPKKDFFSGEASLEALASRSSVFDDENYDEESDKEQDLVTNDSKVDSSLAGEQEENFVDASKGDRALEHDLQAGSQQTEESDTDIQKLDEEGPEVLKRSMAAPLPVLYVEDGMAILRFSEIFGISEPLRKGEKREHRHSIPRDRYKSLDLSDDIVEEDEEEFLKGFSKSLPLTKQISVVRNDASESSDVDLEFPKFGFLHGDATMAGKDDRQPKDSCLSAEPLKVDFTEDLLLKDHHLTRANFYPLDQRDWEEEILWGNSPVASDINVESCEISGPELGVSGDCEIEIESGIQNLQLEPQHMLEEKDHNFFMCYSPVTLDSFGSRDSTGDKSNLMSKSLFHPQLLRLESRSEVDGSSLADGGGEGISEKRNQSGQLKRFTKFMSQNRDLMEGSWLDKIIWEEQGRPMMKSKLIFDLQDDKMHFEVLDNKDGTHLRVHAGAMILTHSLKSSSVDSSEQPGHGVQYGWRYVANDKHYSNRKTSQQLKSNSKKRSAHGVKVFHSQPALKLQTMKLKLSNKDIANFHRPKALWYPHDSGVTVKEQGKLPTHRPMKIIIKSLGGKGSKLHVDAEETLSSVKAKASKKLDFKGSETVKLYYLGRELEDHKSLAAQNVKPNSLIHLVRTKIHLWPRAQRVPGENKSLRPPGAFKKKSDLSVKDGHVFLMEYCEERPLLLSNVGMGARLCTYYQKCSPDDQSGSLLRNTDSSLGHIISLDPADKSPFIGDLKPGCSQSSLETNMYRAPIFPHKVPLTDYLLIRSAKGKLSLRRIDKINVVGQQEPLMEVLSPGSKNFQTYMMNRLLVQMCREFQAAEKRRLPPYIRIDELLSQFPYLSEASFRKKIKEYGNLQRGANGQSVLVKKRNFRMWSEDELRKMVTPELVCAYESMQAGLYRLKHLGITETHPTHISSAMSRLPDEAIALAAASHIERELQITPWNLSSNFVACTSQGKENIERMEITGVGDPSGRGMGFSYARAPPKAPVSNAMVKKKAATRGGSTVTGTDADLRRLSMEAAREVLLKFNVPEEIIAKQTRWHRIAMIRKLSSEQAASGVKVDPTTISKYARGQRMSFLQLQQQTREKCQEIWDRQAQSLSAINGDENESDSEGNSDLDSFAGDLENLLDAEECEEGDEGTNDLKRDKGDGVKGLKMRRHPTLAQAEEEIEDEAAEAAELRRLLMDDVEADRKKKKKARVVVDEARLIPKLRPKFIFDNTEQVKQIANTLQLDGANHFREDSIAELREEENFPAKKSKTMKANKAKKNDITPISVPNKKIKLNMGEGIKVFKEKKPSRETFVCGACGQLGHMRTNKNCPKYGEDLEAQLESTDIEKSGKSIFVDPSSQSQHKAPSRRSISKSSTKIAPVDNSTKIPLKFKCSSTEKSSDKPAIEIFQSSDKPVTSDSETAKSAKVNKIIIPSKVKPDDTQAESLKHAIVIRPPADSGRGLADSHKFPIKIRSSTEIDREQSHKKIIIKRTKEVVDLELDSPVASAGLEHRKTKRIVELSNFEKYSRQETVYSTEGLVKWKGNEDRRWWEEQEKRRNEVRLREDRARRHHKDEIRMLKEQERLDELKRYEEDIRREREEEEQQKAKKKKKKKKHDFRDDYLDDPRSRRYDKRMLERDRSGKRRSAELGNIGVDIMPPTKRRRGGGGEVGLANILEGIVDVLVKDRHDLSYLFQKPVSKKEAPDYFDIIERPMDLSRIRERVRNMEYKSREDFRHDIWQITYNAHKYNNGRNPGIPPLADRLLEYSDYLLNENDDNLTAAEAGIENKDF